MPESQPTGGVVRLRQPGGGFLQARLLVENLLRAHGMEPGRHLLFDTAESCSWLFWAGGRVPEERTLLILSVFMAQGAGYLRLSSPIISLSEGGVPEGFYRRLLELNSEMVSAALATVGLEVHVVAVRPIRDLDASELEDVLHRVTGYSNLFKGQLTREFGVRAWQLAASGEGMTHEDGGQDNLE